MPVLGDNVEVTKPVIAAVQGYAYAAAVRGADLLDSTPRQILLQHALDLPTPTYAHLPLLADADGHKLSKSDAALPVDASHPIATLHALWLCLGQAPLAHASLRTPEEFLDAAMAAFRPERIPRHALSVSAAVHNAAAMSHD